MKQLALTILTALASLTTINFSRAREIETSHVENGGYTIKCLSDDTPNQNGLYKHTITFIYTAFSGHIYIYDLTCNGTAPDDNAYFILAPSQDSGTDDSTEVTAEVYDSNRQDHWHWTYKYWHIVKNGD